MTDFGGAPAGLHVSMLPLELVRKVDTVGFQTAKNKHVLSQCSNESLLRTADGCGMTNAVEWRDHMQTCLSVHISDITHYHSYLDTLFTPFNFTLLVIFV